MQRVLDVMNQVADTDATVLILGESGTGKELVAQALHRVGAAAQQAVRRRSTARRWPRACSRASSSATSAARSPAPSPRRKGRFEAADGGTLFLDEVGDMPLPTQAKLLRTLESGEIVRVGSNDPIRVNVRLIAATNKDLRQAVDAGTLPRGPLLPPPGRDRRAARRSGSASPTCPALAAHFLATSAERHGRPARIALARGPRFAHGLPLAGQRAGAARTSSRPWSSWAATPSSGPRRCPSTPGSRRNGPDPLQSLSGVRLDEIERILVTNTLRDVGGNRERAAKLLGISTRTLYRKIHEYGLGVPGEKRARRGGDRPREAAGTARGGRPAG